MLIPALVLYLLASLAFIGVLALIREAYQKRIVKPKGVASLSVAQSSLTQMQVAFGDIERQLTEAQTKAQRYYNHIAEIEREAQRNIRLYQEQSAEHANAQDMMTRELASFAAQYDNLRVGVNGALTLDPPDLDRAKKLLNRRLVRNQIIVQVLSDFQAKHVPDRAPPGPVSDSA